MIILVKLFLAHLIGDFLLQPKAWVEDKEMKKEKSVFLYLHTLLHLLLVLVLIWKTNFIIYGILIAVSHGIIDYCKLRFQNEKTKRIWFIVDQSMHIVVLILIYFIYTKTTIDVKLIDSRFWIAITAIVFLTKPVSLLIKNIISIWTPENKDDSLQNAGKYIGILERLFVFCFIITNHFEAIGFLLAAKSIFRFGDLKEAKDRKLTEYVLIGTLISFGIALLTGLAVTW